MTQAPGASGPPQPIVVVTVEYGILWSASNGTIGTSDENGQIGWPTTGSFNEVKYNNDVNFIYEIKNQFIGATFVSRTKTKVTTPPDPNSGGGSTTTITYGPPIRLSYNLISFTINSTHESNNKWIYPDDYNAIVDPNYPKQYGGVVLFVENEPGSKGAGVVMEAGCDKDAEYTFISVKGNEQTVISGYNYFECFEKGEYRYKPRNSVALNLRGDLNAKEFIIPSRPYYKDLLDEKGKHAPIYPIDVVTSFNVDLDQQSVVVTYTFNFNVSSSSALGPIQNPTLRMSQTITQPSSVSERLQKLLDVSSYVNPDDFSIDELAPGYTVNYPYTLVSGFDGVGVDPPTERGEDIERYEADVPLQLQRGDVWYNPSNDERKYWKGEDMADVVKVVNSGDNYTSAKNLQVFPTRDVDPGDLVDIPIRLPAQYGLFVDIIADPNGQITSATVVESKGGHNYQNGDIVAVPGGNNNGRLEIIINETNRWVDFYVERN